jgi:hypothetical protein
MIYLISATPRIAIDDYALIAACVAVAQMDDRPVHDHLLRVREAVLEGTSPVLVPMPRAISSAVFKL